MERMTDDEVMTELKSDTFLNKARGIFSHEAARLEQEDLQRVPPTPIERRRLEFECIKRIAVVLGVELSD